MTTTETSGFTCAFPAITFNKVVSVYHGSTPIMDRQVDRELLGAWRGHGQSWDQH